MHNKPQKPALLISNDIGGFRLANEMLEKKYKTVYYQCAGPALKELQKFGNENTQLELENGLSDSLDVFITTGWKTAYEKNMMELCKNKEINFKVCLDHWVNYKDRVTVNGSVLIPEQFIVFDKYAHTICKSIFKDVYVKQVTNYSDQSFFKRYYELKKAKPTHDLLICDPISEHYGDRLGYNEYSQIDFVYEKRRLHYGRFKKLIVRPHPSERVEKYHEYLRLKGYEHVLVSNNSLEADFVRSNLILGCSSYAMHLAVCLRLNVMCSIPKKGFRTQLPHKEIQYLRDVHD